MGPLTLDGGLTVWTLITFGCLFLVLARFTFKPLKKILEERERKLRGSLEQAERARAEAERLLAQNDAKLNEAREETRRIINEGHRIVSDMKREAQGHAKEASDALVNQARQEIDRELQRSLEEMKTTVANLSVRIARQVIHDKVDEAEHERLADEFIERLKKSHAAKRS